MLRLIIADDEEDFREGMRSCIDWAANGLSVVETTSNGPATYDAIVREKPDLVLMDIQMPGMTGLQVIDRVRNIHKLDVSFIILSGYDKFSYAQKAIQLQVDEYLLKPCSIEDVLQAIQRVREHLETNRQLAQHDNDDLLSFYCQDMAHRGSRLHRQPPMDYPIQQEAELMQTLQLGSLEEVMRAFEAFYQNLRQKNPSPQATIHCCVMFYMELYRLLMERGLARSITSLPNLTWDGTDPCASLWSSIHDLLQKAFEILHPKKETSSSISRAVQFINDHYEEELSLDMVSQAVYVTPSYLSGLFKQKLGLSFVDYVNQVRVDKAKKLLITTRLRNYEISQQIGYANEKYFSQIFKKTTGLTPSQFRDGAENQTLAAV